MCVKTHCAELYVHMRRKGKQKEVVIYFLYTVALYFPLLIMFIVSLHWQ